MPPSVYVKVNVNQHFYPVLQHPSDPLNNFLTQNLIFFHRACWPRPEANCRWGRAPKTFPSKSARGWTLPGNEPQNGTGSKLLLPGFGWRTGRYSNYVIEACCKKHFQIFYAQGTRCWWKWKLKNLETFINRRFLFCWPYKL